MKSKESLRLDELTHPETAAFADSIMSHTTDNANYPTHTTSSTDTRSTKNSHRASTINANGGDRQMIAIRKEKLEELSDALIAVRSYTQVTYKGFEIVILSACVPLRKPYTTGLLALTPGNFRNTKMRLVGNVLLEWKMFKNRCMYLMQQNAEANLADDACVFHAFHTKAYCEVHGIKLIKPIALMVLIIITY
jgi:hypothetical protein